MFSAGKYTPALHSTATSPRDSTMSYRDDRTWSDAYLPAIRMIVGPHLLVPAPLELDQTQATDLIVLKAQNITVAARVRRPEYASRFPFDFTIRCRRDSGAETELSKILHGWADWMFYGFANPTDAGTIAHWHLIDLDAFRFELARLGYQHGWRVACEEHDNHDGTHFMAFDVRRFSNCVIASSDPVPPLEAFET
ncbi:hypothetical protein WK39_27805 [Burkholderia cepacia]|nr:hypothetical protein WK39_27805 [Burkholderia cepacia]KVS65696.1 hypothetical protein WK40_12115 [Burkholderia cepacia]